LAPLMAHSSARSSLVWTLCDGATSAGAPLGFRCAVRYATAFRPALRTAMARSEAGAGADAEKVMLLIAVLRALPDRFQDDAAVVSDDLFGALTCGYREGSLVLGHGEGFVARVVEACAKWRAREIGLERLRCFVAYFGFWSSRRMTSRVGVSQVRCATLIVEALIGVGEVVEAQYIDELVLPVLRTGFRAVFLVPACTVANEDVFSLGETFLRFAAFAAGFDDEKVLTSTSHSHVASFTAWASDRFPLMEGGVAAAERTQTMMLFQESVRAVQTAPEFAPSPTLPSPVERTEVGALGDDCVPIGRCTAPEVGDRLARNEKRSVV